MTPRLLRGWRGALLACTWALLLTPAAGFAEPAQGLPELLQRAAAQHPSVRARLNERAAAEFDLQAAAWGRYPSLATELQTERGTTQAIARIEQPVWTGGRLSGQTQRAAAQRDAAEAALDEARLQALLDTASAFFELQRLEARLRAAELNEAEHQRLLATMGRRVQAGVSPAADETQAATRWRQAINERWQTQRQRDNTRLQLAQLVGQEVGPLTRPRPVRLDGPTEQALIEAALRHAPGRKRLQADIEAAEADLVVIRSQRLPQVVVGYQSHLGQRPSGDSRGRAYLAVQMQTGAGLSGLATTAAAVARQAALRDALDQAERDLVQQVRSRWADVQALGSQLAPVQALLSDTGDVVSSYLRQFQVGRKSWLDVLNAQREKTQAQYTLADIEFPLQLARLQLLVLSGALTADNLHTLHD